MIVFREYLMDQLRLHPSIQPRDVVKLCYQAACGAEHLLGDLEGALRFFEMEYEALVPCNGMLYERISEDVCRVNMAVWKQRKLPKAWLFRMFTGTAFSVDGKQNLTKYLDAAEQVLEENSFDIASWQRYRTEYEAEGMPAVRHSETYRSAEQPAYRIVNAAYLPLLPILERAATEEAFPYVIVIDGKAGAGKSTLAERLKCILDADVVSMDDFFLPPHLRTPERLNEAGGNVHYERFAEQVLPNIHKAEPFVYDIFDCSRMAIHGQREIRSLSYRIVEGSYSHHPYFEKYGDLRIFVDVDSEVQMERIVLRNGDAMAERFRTQWIPMENHYFEIFTIREKADVIIK